MNKATIAGRLGGDPEERVTPSGQKLVTFSLACRTWQSGKEDTIWWRITVWGDRCANLIPHIKKGSAVIVTGTIRKPETFTGRDGQARISMELHADSIDFSPSAPRPEGEGHGGSYQQQNLSGQQQPQQNAASEGNYSYQATQTEASSGEEDVPF